uniref:Alternative protein n=1 Tax=Macrostomum lignano TaxID=282301 RepID=A0A1I8GGV7_9PLAT
MNIMNSKINSNLQLVADGGCCLSVKQECCELIIGSIPLWSSLHHQPALPSAPSSQSRLHTKSACSVGKMSIWPMGHWLLEAEAVPPAPVRFSGRPAIRCTIRIASTHLDCLRLRETFCLKL